MFSFAFFRSLGANDGGKKFFRIRFVNAWLAGMACHFLIRA